jgi:hypothetical protein
VKEKIRKIREPITIINKGKSILNTMLILLLGIMLGYFSKWLDNIAFNDAIWWHHLIDVLDLRKVFSELAIWLLIGLAIAVFSYTPVKAGVNTFLFFVGMCITYHIYTIIFSGFNPSQYMLIWYILTLISPVLAMICWYGKGTSILSMLIDALILSVLTMCCFSVGWFYIGIDGIINTIIFIVAVIILYSSPKQVIIAGLTGVALSILISPFVPLG